MSWLTFIITFLFIADWHQITLFVVTLANPSVKKTKLKDESMLKIIEDKAGLSLKHIIVIESDKMHGGMSGIPGKPIMMLSSTLMKNLNQKELEYVLLHEAAHFKYYHPISLAFTQIFLIVSGLFLVHLFNLVGGFLVGFIFALLFVQLARIAERQAENFAAKNMENPRAMISAVNKFEKAWSKGLFAKLRKFISWNVSYEEKRKIALESFS